MGGRLEEGAAGWGGKGSYERRRDGAMDQRFDVREDREEGKRKGPIYHSPERNL